MPRLFCRALCCAGLSWFLCGTWCPRQAVAQTVQSYRSSALNWVDAAASPLPVARTRAARHTTVRAARTQSSRLVSFSWPLGRLHSVALTTEYFKTSTSYVNAYGVGDRPDWKYKSIPVTVSYEFSLPIADRLPLEPYVGVGASVHFSQARSLESTASYVEGHRVFAVDRGMGLGGEAMAGVRYRMPASTYLLAQGRYRLVDGFMLGGTGRAAGQFDQFDFAVGFGVSF